jgi:hypothetical protein
MNHTLAPVWVADVGSGPVSPALVFAVGLVAVLILLALAVVLVAVLAVVLKAGDQRADGLRVLEELGQMLGRVLDAIPGRRRRRRPGEDDDQDDTAPVRRDEEDIHR